MTEFSDEFVEKSVMPCVVRLTASRRSLGSGFFVAPGQVLTCAHVVEGRASVEVEWAGETYGVRKTVMRPPERTTPKDPLYPFPDLALLELEQAPEDHPHILLGDRPPAFGAKVVCCGFSDVNPERRHQQRRHLLEVFGRDGVWTALKGDELPHGMSGSLVFDPGTRRVCGIVKTTRDPRGDRGGWMLDVTKIHAEFEELAERNQRGHGPGTPWRAREEERVQLVQSRLADPLDRAAVALAAMVRERLQSSKNYEVLLQAAKADLPMRLVRKRGWTGPAGERLVFTDAHAAAGMFSGSESRRLVLLGEPGSGKTHAALLLTQALAERALPLNDPSLPAGVERLAAPVPVFVQLAGWRPATGERHTGDTLIDWIVKWLDLEFPTLSKRPYGRSAPKRLLETRRIIPVLDGFDEIGVPGDLTATFERQCAALSEIADMAEKLGKSDGPYGKPGLILTCRTEEYWRAVTGDPPPGVDVTALDAVRARPVHVSAVLEVAPLELADAIGALAEGDADRAAAWQALLDDERAGTLREGLTNPLLVTLARSHYARVGVRSHDPRELLDFGSVPELRDHLLETLIDNAYPDRVSGGFDRWRRADAERWLRFLARGMRDSPLKDIRWWELALPGRRSAVERVLAGLLGLLLVGPAVGLAAGLAFAGSGVAVISANAPLAGTLAGLIVGGLLGLSSMWSRPPPANVSMVRIRPMRVLAAGAFVAAVAALAGWLLSGGEVSGTVLGALVGAPVMVGYMVVDGDATLQIGSPRLMFRGDLRVAWIFTLTYGISILALVWLLTWNPVTALLCAVLCGITGGFTYGVQWALALQVKKVGVIAIVHLFSAKLAAGNGLPWSLIDFLDDARSRGVLYQNGPSYRFRHDYLQELLAREPEKRA